MTPVHPGLTDRQEERRALDIAWAAGLWEGEGCWSISRKPDGSLASVVARLSMTDADVVERFAATVGFGRVRSKATPSGRRPVTEWSTARRESVQGLVRMFRPYLGERRLAKAQEVLDLGPASPRSQRPTCGRGHDFTGGNLALVTVNGRNGRVYQGRRCRACSADRSRAYAARRQAEAQP